MSDLALNRIRKRIESSTGPIVDVSDVRDPKDVEIAQLTRGLAAWVLARLCGLDDKTAVDAVVDGFDDNGIDAIYVDREAKVIYLVQSKWSRSGKGAPSLDEVIKFVQGVRLLVNAEWSRFNTKVQAKSGVIDAALDDPDVTLSLVLASSGADALSKAALATVDDLLAVMNDGFETAKFESFRKAQLHDMLRANAASPLPTIPALISNWGKLSEPYTAYYGQVEASQVAEWHAAHGVRLFESNIRHPFGNDSEVNDSLRRTLIEEPQHFWYLNNGITVLCQSISKAVGGATSNRLGSFEFREVSVVNGAQTVGVIGQVAKTHPESVADARVTVRFISLEGCPPGFASDVTSGTNTQNRVERRDFVSLDPEQVRLTDDLGFDDVRYIIKNGQQAEAGTNSFTVLEATVALACSDPDPDLAVQAKREVGRLWVGAEKPEPDGQYRQLFNANLSAGRLWRTVQLARRIDEAIASVRSSYQGKENKIGVHGNRLIAHLVFQALGVASVRSPSSDLDEVLARVPSLTSSVYSTLITVIESDFQENYVASLFKNATRCRAIANSVAEALAIV